MEKYHIRRKDKEIRDPEAIREALRKGKFVSIALCRDNVPYIVTMNYGYDEEHSCLYFHCAKEGKKLDYITGNPKACATLVHDKGYKYSECDHGYQSLIIDGTMEIVEGHEEKKHAFLIMLKHLEPDWEEMQGRIFKTERIYETAHILKLKIECVSGKEG